MFQRLLAAFMSVGVSAFILAPTTSAGGLDLGDLLKGVLKDSARRAVRDTAEGMIQRGTEQIFPQLRQQRLGSQGQQRSFQGQDVSRYYHQASRVQRWNGTMKPSLRRTMLSKMFGLNELSGYNPGTLSERSLRQLAGLIGQVKQTGAPVQGRNDLVNRVLQQSRTRGASADVVGFLQILSQATTPPPASQMAPGAYPPGAYPAAGYRQGGYPPVGYPPQQGYAPQGYAPQAAYPQPGYPPRAYPQPGYPASAYGYPPGYPMGPSIVIQTGSGGGYAVAGGAPNMHRLDPQLIAAISSTVEKAFEKKIRANPGSGLSSQGLGLRLQEKLAGAAAAQGGSLDYDTIQKIVEESLGGGAASSSTPSGRSIAETDLYGARPNDTRPAWDRPAPRVVAPRYSRATRSEDANARLARLKARVASVGRGAGGGRAASPVPRPSPDITPPPAPASDPGVVAMAAPVEESAFTKLRRARETALRLRMGLQPDTARPAFRPMAPGKPPGWGERAAAPSVAEDSTETSSGGLDGDEWIAPHLDDAFRTRHLTAVQKYRGKTLPEIKRMVRDALYEQNRISRFSPRPEIIATEAAIEGKIKNLVKSFEILEIEIPGEGGESESDASTSESEESEGEAGGE